MFSRFVIPFFIIWFVCNPLNADTTKTASQNPSPMQEHIRDHKRIGNKDYPGTRFTIGELLPQDVKVFIPEGFADETEYDILVHFHGASYVVEYAAQEYNKPVITITINLGAGSSKYSKPFKDITILGRLLDAARKKAGIITGKNIKTGKLTVSGFSAGYGAVRELLSQKTWKDSIDKVILLDGIHASYIPEGVTLYEGGIVDSSDVEAFLNFAEKTASGSTGQEFLITHSEIFPGAYVSTTEATQYILDKLGIKRKAVLEWGPLGMQKLSDQGKNNFRVVSFAGNTAPDHVDHLHALYYFLNKE